MFNETEAQTILRRAKDAMQAANQKAADARRALVDAETAAKRAKKKYEELFLQEERREVARRRAAYDHCTK